MIKLEVEMREGKKKKRVQEQDGNSTGTRAFVCKVPLSIDKRGSFSLIPIGARPFPNLTLLTYISMTTALARSRHKNCGLNQNGLRTESEVRKRGRLTRPLTQKRSNSENHQGCPRKRSNSENGVSTKDVPDEEAVPKEPRGLEATLEHLHKNNNNNNNNNNNTKCNTEEQYTRIRMDYQKAEDKIDVSAIHVFPQMPSCSVKYEVDMIVYGIGNQTTTRTTTTTTAKGKLRATPHQERFLVED